MRRDTIFSVWILWILVALLLPVTGRAAPSYPPPPEAATQAEVNAGTRRDKYVSPATLAGAVVVDTPVDWTGEWSAATTYAIGEGVTRNGSSFAALQAHTNQEPVTSPAPASSAYWQLVAAKGDAGAPGPQGEPGEQGEPGLPGGTWGGIGGTIADQTDLTAALFGKANDNTSGNRNVATLSGNITLSANRDEALGKKFQWLDPDGAPREIAFAAPGSTGETIRIVKNTGTALADILRFTDPAEDIDLRAGETLVATWNSTGWDFHVIGRSQELITNSKSGDYTLGTDSLDELYGGVIYVTGAATITVPAVQSGMSFTIITVGAVAVSVDVNAADRTILDGTALADGDKITNTSTAGDIAVFTYESASGFYAATNGWTDTN
jgi:hypothetical protein